MTSSLIRAKYLLTGVIDDETTNILTDAAIYQTDGVIKEVGDYAELRHRHSPAVVIGDGRQMAIPGLINAHHHVGLTPFQLGSPDLALEPWIVVRAMNRDVDPYLDTLYCAIQMIEAGITGVMHNHAAWRRHGESTFNDVAAQVIKAYQDAGMRVAFSFSHRDQNRIVYQDDETFLKTLPQDLAVDIRSRLDESQLATGEYIDLVEDVHRQFAGDPRVNVFFSPGNVQWCSDGFLESVKDAAASLETGIHIHLQESFYQRDYAMERWSKTPLAHLQDLRFPGGEVSCAHGVWLTGSDIAIMAETKAMICHNPSSNLRLRSGVAPINEALASGVTVALGIDEAGINDDNDMLLEMRLAHKLHRQPGVDSPAPTSHQILRVATEGGAKATFFDGDVGRLEPGMKADVVLVNMERIEEPYLHPDTNPVDALLYRARGEDVDTVVVNGETTLQDGAVTRVNKADVWSELKARLSRSLSAAELERIDEAQRLLPHVQSFYAKWPAPSGRPHYRYNEAE